MSSLAPDRMRDAPVTARPATPKPSLVQRLAAGWRRARSAALLHMLADVDEPGRPSPRRLVPWVHPTLRGLAHPATWEIGIPLVILIPLGTIARFGWDRVAPSYPEKAIAYLIAMPLLAAIFAKLGRGLLDRRYTRLALEEYHRVRWSRQDEGHDA